MEQKDIKKIKKQIDELSSEAKTLAYMLFKFNIRITEELELINERIDELKNQVLPKDE